MASTASFRSILPQPPLVCHIPFRTRHISKESFPFFTVTLLASAVSVLVQHLTESGLSFIDSDRVDDRVDLIEWVSRKWWTAAVAIVAREQLCRKTQTLGRRVDKKTRFHKQDFHHFSFSGEFEKTLMPPETFGKFHCNFCLFFLFLVEKIQQKLFPISM